MINNVKLPPLIIEIKAANELHFFPKYAHIVGMNNPATMKEYECSIISKTVSNELAIIIVILPIINVTSCDNFIILFDLPRKNPGIPVYTSKRDPEPVEGLLPIL